MNDFQAQAEFSRRAGFVVASQGFQDRPPDWRQAFAHTLENAATFDDLSASQQQVFLQLEKSGLPRKPFWKT